MQTQHRRRPRRSTPTTCRACCDLLRQHLRGDAALFLSEHRIRNAGGQWAWMRARGRVVERDADGRALRVAGTARDITASRSAERERRMSSEVLRSMAEAVAVFDRDFVFISVNPAFTRMTGYGDAEVIGRSTSLIDSSSTTRTSTGTCAPNWSATAAGPARSGSSARTAASSCAGCRPARCTTRSGQRSHYVAVLADITDQKRAEQELRYLANYDTLTSLPNRALLSERLSRAIVRARRNGTAHRGAVPRPGPLQGHQRLARPCRRRPHPARRRRAPAADRRRRAHRRAPGRRRVHRGAGGHRHRRGRRAGRARASSPRSRRRWISTSATTCRSRRRSASACTPTTRRCRPTCSSTPTPRCTRPRPPAAAPSCATPRRWTSRSAAAPRSPRALRKVLDRDELRLVFQPRLSLAEHAHHRRRGAAALDQRRARRDPAVAVHPAGRGERPDPGDRRMGAARGLRGAQALAPAGPARPDHGGQRLGAAAAARRPARRGRARARGNRRAGRHAWSWNSPKA